MSEPITLPPGTQVGGAVDVEQLAAAAEKAAAARGRAEERIRPPVVLPVSAALWHGPLTDDVAHQAQATARQAEINTARAELDRADIRLTAAQQTLAKFRDLHDAQVEAVLGTDWPAPPPSPALADQEARVNRLQQEHDRLKVKLNGLVEADRQATALAEAAALDAPPPAKEDGSLDRDATVREIEMMWVQLEAMRHDEQTARLAGVKYNFTDRLEKLTAKRQRFLDLLEGRDPSPAATSIAVDPLSPGQLHLRERMRQLVARLAELDDEIKELKSTGELQGWTLTAGGLKDLADLQAERAALVREELEIQQPAEAAVLIPTVKLSTPPAAAPVEVAPLPAPVIGQGPDVAEADVQKPRRATRGRG
jgi:hypothetical protein